LIEHVQLSALSFSGRDDHELVWLSSHWALCHCALVGLRFHAALYFMTSPVSLPYLWRYAAAIQFCHGNFVAPGMESLVFAGLWAISVFDGYAALVLLNAGRACALRN